MGLDMYLNGRAYLSAYDEEGQRKQEEIRKLFATTALGKFTPTYVTFEVMYWRKANAIHRWFVDNVQNGVDDCGTYPVSLDQLMELRETVETVLRTRDVDEAHVLMPPAAGFFFGSPEMDSYYWEYLNETKACLDIVAKKFFYTKLSGDTLNIYFEYSSSW